MKIIGTLMQHEVKVYSIKENFELSNNIVSKVLAFAFGLSAETERQSISQRTKEGLARVKTEGGKIGYPKGQFSINTTSIKVIVRYNYCSRKECLNQPLQGSSA
jgi:DNA invertase Pin-like site-specific DNA recombinase